MFLKPKRPKYLRFNPAIKISFDLMHKKTGRALETKDSSPADYYLPNNKRRRWPPQNGQTLIPGQYFNLTPMGLRRKKYGVPFYTS
jgi:hypothetical protein